MPWLGLYIIMHSNKVELLLTVILWMFLIMLLEDSMHMELICSQGIGVWTGNKWNLLHLSFKDSAYNHKYDNECGH